MGLTGCRSWLPLNNQVRRIEPAMSMSIDRDTLVQQINQHSAGLNGWRSVSTKLTVRMPRMLPQRLTGSIACKSPNYFRLVANNVIAKADLGSNASKCWAYVQPGEAAVLTWNHEDTDLIQQLPLGVPYIDPNWLMLVLGITPLDASDYQLGPGPNGRSELWLTAMEQSPQGRMMKRVIKVDAVEGVVREHALYDDSNNAVVRAVLSSHRPHAGYLVPEQVRLIFPPMKTELTLSFNDVETNPALPDQLWHMPKNNVQVVDLGMLARQRLIAEGHRFPPPSESVAQQRNDFQQSGGFPDSSPNIQQSSFERVAALNEQSSEFETFEDFMRSEEAAAEAETSSLSDDAFFQRNSEDLAAPVFDDHMPAPDWDNGGSSAGEDSSFFGF